MPSFREDHDHLTHLAEEFRKLARRTDEARNTAVGWSDFGPGVAHDRALNEQIDWFYRRWVQRVETAQSCLLAEADHLEGARMSYHAVDETVRAAAACKPTRRPGADL